MLPAEGTVLPAEGTVLPAEGTVLPAEEQHKQMPGALNSSSELILCQALC